MPHPRRPPIPTATSLAGPWASLLAAGLVLGTGCQKVADQPSLAGQDVHLTVIHTADLHSRLFPYQFAPGQIDKTLGLVPSRGNTALVGGAARIKTVIDTIRRSTSRAIHVDTGDVFQGAPVFNLFAGEVEMKTMTRFGVTAMALGNHEFDKGIATLVNQKSVWGNFPLLAANYNFVDPNEYQNQKLRNIVLPWTMLNANGIRIGIIGLGNVSSLNSLVEGGNSLGARPLNTTQVIRDAIRILRPQVDLLMVVSHLGLEEEEQVAQAAVQSERAGMACQELGSMCNTTQDCCPGLFCSEMRRQCESRSIDENENIALEGIDVIFGGHLHIVLNPPKDFIHLDDQGRAKGHTILCHSGAFAKFVGRLDLVVHLADPLVRGDRTFVKSYTYQPIPIDDRIPEDPEMVNFLEPYQLKMNRTLALTQNLAIIPCPKDQATCPKILRSDPDGGDSQLGNLVATSMRLRRRVEADFAVTNTLGIRADFESGPLNVEQMYNVFPFDNFVTTMFLSGNEIREMIDFMAQRSGERGCRSQAQVSGIWFLLDCQKAIACGPFDAQGNLATECHKGGGEWWRPSGAVDGPPMIGDKCILREPSGVRKPNPACRKIAVSGEYRVAVNDYIANGGSGFQMLKRNTTKFNTGISLRDALSDFIRNVPIRCGADVASNIVYDAQDPTEPFRKCTANGDPGTIQFQCGPGHVCPGGACLRHYDFSGLPCLDFTVEAHDGRIGTVR